MDSTFTLAKDEIVRLETQKIERELIDGSWSLNEKVALTCHILHAHGHDSGLAGQITALSDSGNYFTQRLGCGFDEVTASNLLTVDENLNVLEGEGMPNPANRFHSWVYRSRPGTRCIIHTHPLYTSALSMLEEPLKLSHMDTCVLYDDVAFLPKWPGIPVGNEVGDVISSALGNKRALLLGHHGLLVACGSVEEACILAIQFERAARLQMIASSIGKIKEIVPALGEEAKDWILQEKRSKATFSYHARRVLKESSFCIS